MQQEERGYQEWDREKAAEHSIAVVFEPKMRGAPVKDIATITGSISRVAIIWKGQEVTKLPAGEFFDVNVYFSASNPAGGQWCFAGTVISTDGALSNYEIAKNNGVSTTMGGAGQYITLNKYGSLKMPNGPVILRVTPWGYPFWTDTPPDKSAW